jgi:hypothetical protein
LPIRLILINLHWLDDYVSDKKQKVVVNNECSNPNTVKAGVPQGSVLEQKITSDTIGLQFFLSMLYAKPYQMPLIYHN